MIAGHGSGHVGSLSDEELVRLARGGDEAAFDAIVHRYRAPLHSYCRRWLDAHRAEEVVQHTLMKAFLCLRDDDRPLALRPWLYRVAHNAALNALEKKGSDWEELDENYDGVPQPPQVAERRAHFLEVVSEIDALPLRQREALLLNEFEGRCYSDIASELGTSESGVRGLLRRARSKLRETAAALLFPFPALRELVRADGGRSLQGDRAGEIIGTAGAAGGLGAAGGGLAKVAAGVLAAGTIAGGGTALEHRGSAAQPPDAEARQASTPRPGARHEPPRQPAAATPGDHARPSPAARISADSRGRLQPNPSRWPFRSEQQGSLNSVQSAPVPSEEPSDGVTVPAPPELPPLAGLKPDGGATDEPDSAAGEAEADESTPSSSGSPSSGSAQKGEAEDGSSTIRPILPRQNT